MNSILKISLFLCLLVQLTSCSSNENASSSTGCKMDKDDAKNINEKRDIKGFTGVKLNNNSSVNIVKSKEFYVSVSGKPLAVKRVTTTISDNNLVIDLAEKCDKQPKTIVTVHLPNLTNIKLNGSGGMNVQGGFRDSLFNVNITGSGNITVDPLSHFGTSTIKISGSGNFDAFRAICDHANLEITGSGNIKISPLKSLNAIISGSGNVNYGAYEGMDVKYQLTGSGTLRKFSR